MKPVIVTIHKTRHKSQPYKFSIDGPGYQPNTTNDERYTEAKSARRGALRLLDARTYPALTSGRSWGFTGGYLWVTPKGRKIVFKSKP
ncbi:MAG TPA: hypothetical protein PKJ19_13530 [Flavobacteriales bacterium]|nr:hypothetical protein [Flavobacteriales bacterium]